MKDYKYQYERLLNQFYIFKRALKLFAEMDKYGELRDVISYFICRVDMMRNESIGQLNSQPLKVKVRRISCRHKNKGGT